MRLTQLFLLVQTLALLGLGLAYFIQPHEMTNLSGMLLRLVISWGWIKYASPKTIKARACTSRNTWVMRMLNPHSAEAEHILKQPDADAARYAG